MCIEPLLLQETWFCSKKNRSKWVRREHWQWRSDVSFSDENWITKYILRFFWWCCWVDEKSDKSFKGAYFCKKIQSAAYNKHKVTLTDDDLLVNVDFAESYRSDQESPIQIPYFGNQNFSLFTSCCYYKSSGNILQQKCIVTVTKN